jgi:hypothetical protein
MGVKRALPLVFVLALTACGGAPPPTVPLRVTGGPPNARVTVDDAYMGTLDVIQARGLRIPAGSHRISVEAPGYFPLDRVIEAPEGAGPVRFDVKLEPIPE